MVVWFVGSLNRAELEQLFWENRSELAAGRLRLYSNFGWSGNNSDQVNVLMEGHQEHAGA